MSKRPGYEHEQEPENCRHSAWANKRVSSLPRTPGNDRVDEEESSMSIVHVDVEMCDSAMKQKPEGGSNRQG